MASQKGAAVAPVVCLNLSIPLSGFLAVEPISPKNAAAASAAADATTAELAGDSTSVAEKEDQLQGPQARDDPSERVTPTPQRSPLAAEGGPPEETRQSAAFAKSWLLREELSRILTSVPPGELEGVLKEMVEKNGFSMSSERSLSRHTSKGDFAARAAVVEDVEAPGLSAVSLSDSVGEEIAGDGAMEHNGTTPGGDGAILGILEGDSATEFRGGSLTLPAISETEQLSEMGFLTEDQLAEDELDLPVIWAPPPRAEGHGNRS